MRQSSVYFGHFLVSVYSVLHITDNRLLVSTSENVPIETSRDTSGTSRRLNCWSTRAWLCNAHPHLAQAHGQSAAAPPAPAASKVYQGHRCLCQLSACRVRSVADVSGSRVRSVADVSGSRVRSVADVQGSPTVAGSPPWTSIVPRMMTFYTQNKGHVQHPPMDLY